MKVNIYNGLNKTKNITKKSYIEYHLYYESI